MEGIVIAFGLYLLIGLVSCLTVARSAEKKGKPVLIPLDPSPLFFIPLLALWPIFLFIAIFDLRIGEEPENEMNQGAPQESLIGRYGLATTMLKPMGKIRIDDRIVEASADSGTIEENSEIEIVSRNMTHYVVKKREPGEVVNANPAARLSENHLHD